MAHFTKDSASAFSRLNPMVENDKWTRLGVDATVSLPREQKYVRATMRGVDLGKFEIEG